MLKIPSRPTCISVPLDSTRRMSIMIPKTKWKLEKKRIRVSFSDFIDPTSCLDPININRVIFTLIVYKKDLSLRLKA